MGLFSRKAALSLLFKDYVDCHCHILPGVDDGVQSFGESLSILKRYFELGVKKVWLTPHVMEDCPNTPQELTERFELLRQRISFPAPELCLAAENMLDPLFVERLQQGEVLTHTAGHILVETSYFSPPFDMKGILFSIKAKGLTPILAHPERYIYMSNEDYDSLKDQGIRFQLNISSLAGFYGNAARKKAERLLALGYYDCTGTDLHAQAMLDKYLKAEIDEKVLEKVMALIASYR